MFLNKLSKSFLYAIGGILELYNDTPKTYIYDQPLSWLGTGTSIKSDGLKLVL
jgi:hypothetical protein